MCQLREIEDRDELSTPVLQKSLVMEYEKLVAEWGSRRVDVWIRYVRYLMHVAPVIVGKINEVGAYWVFFELQLKCSLIAIQRAYLNLPSDLVEEFHAEWTRVMMGDTND